MKLKNKVIKVTMNNSYQIVLNTVKIKSKNLYFIIVIILVFNQNNQQISQITITLIMIRLHRKVFLRAYHKIRRLYNCNLNRFPPISCTHEIC